MLIDKNGNQWYKLGLHIHTTLSDGAKTPEQVAGIYKSAGYDAIALTDHWHYGAAGEIDGLKILSGCEYNLCGNNSLNGVMHIVGVGMEHEPKIDKNTATRRDVVDAINEAGGFAVLAHPAWSLNTPKDALELPGLAATEIYNAISTVGQSEHRAYSGYFVDLLANEGVALVLLAVDDAHMYNGEDETKAFVMVRAKSFDDRSLLEAVRDGDFYASQAPELYTVWNDGTLTIECSPCRKIAVLSNLVWVCDHVKAGEGLTHMEYTPKPGEKYVRVEVTDENGKRAWSNVFPL